MHVFLTSSSNSMGGFFWTFKTNPRPWTYIQNIGTIFPTVWSGTELKPTTCSRYFCNKGCCFANLTLSGETIASSVSNICSLSNSSDFCSLVQYESSLYWSNNLYRRATVVTNEYSTQQGTNKSSICNSIPGAYYCRTKCHKILNRYPNR